MLALILLFIVSVTVYPHTLYIWMAAIAIRALVRWHWKRIGYLQ